MNKTLSSRLQDLTNKGKVQLGNRESGRGSFTVAFAYESFTLHSSNGVSQRWSQLELVAHESGRKESFDRILKVS